LHGLDPLLILRGEPLEIVSFPGVEVVSPLSQADGAV
jgi:hypothetical protein